MTVPVQETGADARAAEQHAALATDHLMSNLKARSLRGGAIALTSQLAGFAIRTGSTMILARLLTPAEFGLTAMVLPLTGFVKLFKDLGLTMATIQSKGLKPEQVSLLFWVNVAVSAVLSLIAIAAAPLVAWFYDDPRVMGITVAYGLLFIFGGFSAQHQALIRRQMRFGALAAVDLTSLALGIVAGVAGAMAGMSYWALVLMMGVTEASAMVMVWSLSRWRPGRVCSFNEVRAMLRFGANLTSFNVINYLARNVDNVLVGKFWGEAAAGLYSKAYGLMLLPLSQINVPLGNVAIPALSRLQSEPARYRAAYLGVASRLAVLTMPAGAWAMVVADWLVLLFLGPQWTEAGRIFFFLGISAVTQPLLNTMGWLFITQGRTKEMMQFGWVNGVLCILSMLVGLPWGGVGVAIAYSVVGVAIRMPMAYIVAGRRGHVSTRDLCRLTVLPTVAALAAAAAATGYRVGIAFGQPLVDSALALLCALTATWIVLVLTPEGRVLLRQSWRWAGLMRGGDGAAR
jgi:O-antigen/teichoic acid export membrane protein